jgi:L-ascorbate metabolism protein UlaG (beta-lactamase superfamily)
MDITWFGRSCVRLQSSQATVLTDPFGPLPPPALAGIHVVTLSDRARRDELMDVSGARVIDGPGEYEVRGIPVSGVALSVPSGIAGAEGGGRKTFVYTVTLDGIAICHLGRLPELPAGAGLQEIGQADVLLIPLGEPEGLSAARAVQIASQLEAKLLVPLTLGGPNDATVLETFCRELGADPTAVTPRVSVTATALAAGTRVALLTPQGGA